MPVASAMGFLLKRERFMDQIAATSILFDIYGGLLTEKKREVMELYHEENLSLSEIAEVKGISRAAVHDALKSAENSLAEYEAKLGLAEAYLKRLEIVDTLRRSINYNLNNAIQGKPVKTERIEKLLAKLED